MAPAEASTFGALLRAHRLAAGLTQDELAERAGLSGRGVQDLERGVRRLPQLGTARRLADALGLASGHRAALLAAGRPIEVLAEPAPPLPSPTARPAESRPDLPGSRRARLHNLPTALSSFVGREQELGELANLLDRTRLLTLTGAGGSGKTRLALELTGALLGASRFPDGVWLVELAVLAEAALVPQAVASVFRIEGVAEQPLVEVLVGALQERALLLVLDNCEHLIEACAGMAERLLRDCPSVRILATSREPLRITGEVAWRVPPLQVPDLEGLPPLEELARVPAVRLFVTRAQAVQPSFVLGQANADSVARVCARLEGLPLALELAAARTRVLTPAQLLTYLEDLFRLLVGGSRAAPTRQQTLRATLDWSHALLSQPEQVLFRRLAVFAGSCDLAAAEGVCADLLGRTAATELAATDVLDLLTQLVDKSLVVVTEHGSEARYRLLEPVRQYALQRLEASGEREQLAERHAEAYFQRAEAAQARLMHVLRRADLDRLECDLDNLRAALDWCRAEPQRVDHGLRLAGGLFRFWDSGGHSLEGRRWLSDLLARAPEPGPSVGRGKALFAAGWLVAQQDGLEAARELAAASVALWEQLGDPAWLGWARWLDGFVWRLSDPALTLRRAQQSLAAAGACGDETLAAYALFLIGEAHRVQGDLDGAVRFLEEVRAGAMERQHPWGVGFALRSLAQVAGAQGDYQRASDLLRERLVIVDQEGERANIPDAIEGLAWVAAVQGRPERATRLYAAADAQRVASGLPPLLGTRRARYEGRLAALRPKLGEAGFDAAWTSGRRLSLDQAVALALDDTETSHRARADTADSPATDSLTYREREVAALLAEGRTNRQIAAALTISERTASVHVQHILAKLDLRSRWQVADWLAGASRTQTA